VHVPSQWFYRSEQFILIQFISGQTHRHYRIRNDDWREGQGCRRIFINFIFLYHFCNVENKIEELDGPAVRALGVRSRTKQRMGDQNLLARATPCFRRYVKPLVPAAFAVVCTHSSFKEDWRQAGVRSKNYCRIFVTTWRKHVVLIGIRVEKEEDRK
jgi:hypothetical protein